MMYAFMRRHVHSFLVLGAAENRAVGDLLRDEVEKRCVQKFSRDDGSVKTTADLAGFSAAAHAARASRVARNHPLSP